MTATLTTEPVTGKRKRATPLPSSTHQTTLHITVGSYERVLHGFTASVHTRRREEGASASTDGPVAFTNSFLLNAHTSSIRCLALSPSSSHRRMLATGSPDERINLYQLSTLAPPPPPSPSSALHKKQKQSLLPTPAATPTTSTASIATPTTNRTLGTLAHHVSTITTLAFPTSSKLLTASLDNTISLLRSRDWIPLTTLKAPVPKPAGRPSGDTIGPGEVPAGVSDIAVHPSLRFAISVGVGERCMRLWNLVSGKKAGVLLFEKTWLAAAGEGSSGNVAGKLGIRGGEAKRIVWAEDGEQFAVGFERGALIYGLDCEIRGALRVDVRDRITQIRFVDSIAVKQPGDVKSDSMTNGHAEPTDKHVDPPAKHSILAVATESGTVVFFDTFKPQALTSNSTEPSDSSENNKTQKSLPTFTPFAKLVHPLSDTTASIPAPRAGRIKDFVVLREPPGPALEREINGAPNGDAAPPPTTESNYTAAKYYMITAHSSGAVNIFSLDKSVFTSTSQLLTLSSEPHGAKNPAPTNGLSKENPKPPLPQVGSYIGTYETGRRITCLAAFIMEPSPLPASVDGMASGTAGSGAAPSDSGVDNEDDDYVDDDEVGIIDGAEDCSNDAHGTDDGASESDEEAMVHDAKADEDLSGSDDFGGFDE